MNCHLAVNRASRHEAMTVMGFMDYIVKEGSSSKITCYLGLAENMIDG